MQRCTRPYCHLAGDSLGTCVEAQSIMGCGRPVDVIPAKDVVLRCSACYKTVAFTVDEIMRGKVDRSFCRGETDACKAVALKAPIK